MALANGFFKVPKGKVAAVVTHFEMRAPAPLRPVEPPQGWALERVTLAKVDWYRSLYRRVGRDYLWWSRLMLADDALKAIISIVSNERLRVRPIAPGAISIAMTRMMPVALSAVTMVIARRRSTLNCNDLTDRPNALAWEGAKQ